MIKINLASLKQVSGTSAAEEGGQTKTGMKLDPFSRFRVDFDKVKELPFQKFIVSIAVALVGSYLLNSYKEDELKKNDDITAKLNAERTRLQAEVNKTKGYEDIKKSLESDELIIRTKIDTIQKLIVDRQTPPKLLLSLAQSIPKEVWLTEFKMNKGEASFRGSAMGFNPISDFMKSLNENVYFTEISLKTTQQAKEDSGAEVATFELAAKRREQK